jgi:uncharacterized protein (DUF2336 family)
MIVRDFLDWVRTAPAGKRAEATSALARAYLYSDLSPDDLGAAEGAMLMLLDDPSPLVRRALADALAASPSAPPAVVLALAELADMPVARVSGLVHDRGSAGLRALLDRARLPPSTYPAFKAAIEAMHEGGFVGEPGGAVRLKRRMVERVLTGCGKEALGDVAPLLTLLRRFATEAAREEARLFCDELVAEAFDDEPQSAAA